MPASGLPWKSDTMPLIAAVAFPFRLVGNTRSATASKSGPVTPAVRFLRVPEGGGLKNKAVYRPFLINRGGRTLGAYSTPMVKLIQLP